LELICYAINYLKYFFGVPSNKPSTIYNLDNKRNPCSGFKVKDMKRHPEFNIDNNNFILSNFFKVK